MAWHFYKHLQEKGLERSYWLLWNNQICKEKRFAFLHMALRITQVAQQNTECIDPAPCLSHLREQCVLPFNASQSSLAALQKHQKNKGTKENTLDKPSWTSGTFYLRVANVQALYGFDVADLHNLHILQSLIDIIFMDFSLWSGFCPFCGLALHSWNEASAKWWQLQGTIALTMFVFPAYFSLSFRTLLPSFPMLLFTLLFHLHPWGWESGTSKWVKLLWS